MSSAADRERIEAIQRQSERLRDKARALRDDAADWREASDKTGGYTAGKSMKDAALENEQKSVELDAEAAALDWLLSQLSALTEALSAAQQERGPDAFEGLLALKEGWDGYGAPPLDPSTVESARAFLKRVSVVPGADGSVQLEWHTHGFDLEIDFTPEGKSTGWLKAVNDTAEVVSGSVEAALTAQSGSGAGMSAADRERIEATEWVAVVGTGSMSSCYGTFASYDDAAWWLKSNGWNTSNCDVRPIRKVTPDQPSGHGWHSGGKCDEPDKPEAGPMRDTESPSGVQALGSTGPSLQSNPEASQLSALSEALSAAQQARDKYRTLANVGVWHSECRPNREMAARELAKSQAIIDKLADTISQEAEALTACQQERDKAQRDCEFAQLAMRHMQERFAKAEADLTASQQEREYSVLFEDNYGFTGPEDVESTLKQNAAEIQQLRADLTACRPQAEAMTLAQQVVDRVLSVYREDYIAKCVATEPDSLLALVTRLAAALSSTPTEPKSSS